MDGCVLTDFLNGHCNPVKDGNFVIVQVKKVRVLCLYLLGITFLETYMWSKLVFFLFFVFLVSYLIYQLPLSIYYCVKMESSGSCLYLFLLLGCLDLTNLWSGFCFIWLKRGSLVRLADNDCYLWYDDFTGLVKWVVLISKWWVPIAIFGNLGFGCCSSVQLGVYI